MEADMHIIILTVQIKNAIYLLKAYKFGIVSLDVVVQQNNTKLFIRYYVYNTYETDMYIFILYPLHNSTIMSLYLIII